MRIQPFVQKCNLTQHIDKRRLWRDLITFGLRVSRTGRNLGGQRLFNYEASRENIRRQRLAREEIGHQKPSVCPPHS